MDGPSGSPRPDALKTSFRPCGIPRPTAHVCVRIFVAFHLAMDTLLIATSALLLPALPPQRATAPHLRTMSAWTASRATLRMEAAEAATASNTTTEELPDSIFTLQERDDGWDDVRASIKAARDDRKDAWDLINQEYVKPAARWSKVLAEEFLPSEVPQELPALQLPKIELPKPGEAAPKLSTKEVAIATTASVLDAVAAARQTKPPATKKKAPPKTSKTKSMPPKTVSPAGAASVGLLLGVPGLTLGALFLLATQQL
jgi:hypothetical protein